jgi:sugar phosphate isomerase/epimerase
MVTRLGIGSYAFAWAIGVPRQVPPVPMDTIAFLNTAAQLDVHLVQIADNLPLDHLSAAQLSAVQAEAERLHIAIEVGTRGIAPDHLRRYLQLAQQFQSPILRVVVDTADYHPDPPEIIATLRAVLPAFEAAGIILALENHDRFKARTFAHIMDQLDSPAVGICLDTVNSFGALEGPDIVIETLGPYVVNLHVKDFAIRRVESNMGFILEGTPAGQGELDVPRLLAQLGPSGRDFNAILELWPPPERSVAATMAKEADWAAASIAYLRQHIKD